MKLLLAVAVAVALFTAVEAKPTRTDQESYIDLVKNIGAAEMSARFCKGARFDEEQAGKELLLIRMKLSDDVLVDRNLTTGMAYVASQVATGKTDIWCSSERDWVEIGNPSFLKFDDEVSK